MKTILAIFALISVMFIGPVQANDEAVDCFYESNAGHPDCRK